MGGQGWDVNFGVIEILRKHNLKMAFWRDFLVEDARTDGLVR
jgi:hypothetical protein